MLNLRLAACTWPLTICDKRMINNIHNGTYMLILSKKKDEDKRKSEEEVKERMKMKGKREIRL